MRPREFIMTLPVSMEDTSLFPFDSHLDTSTGDILFEMESMRQMRASLSRLWWSRLVISVRGYVINYVQTDEPTLFHCDDAFTAIHRFLAEEQSETDRAEQFLSDLSLIVQYPLVSETLLALASGRSTSSSPFSSPLHTDAFTRVFGAPNDITYKVANGQKCAYIVFMRVLCILQSRWKTEREKKKGIRFATDPEWQPDDRVVLFQQFFQGASIIFGDRFVEKKLRMGMQLCSYCGMIEQQPSQFPSRNGNVLCSQECLDATNI